MRRLLLQTAAPTRAMRRILVTVVMILLALPLLGWLSQPSPWALRWARPGATSYMLYRERQARRADDTLSIERTWVPLDELPESLVRAVIAAEDHRFREHEGVDWLALGEEVRYDRDEAFSWTDARDRAALADAIRYGWRNRGEIRGRSTITMQLARNLFYTPDRSVVRKAMEIPLAGRLEWWLPKDRILEIYLNSVELGHGVFGVEAAAQRYWGISARDLNRTQSASLAATLPHPRTSNPGYRPGRMQWRRDLILGRLAGGSAPVPPPIPEAPEPLRVDLPDEAPDVPVDPPPVDPAPADTIGNVGAPGDTAGTVPPDTVGGGGAVADTVAVGDGVWVVAARR